MRTAPSATDCRTWSRWLLLAAAGCVTGGCSLLSQDGVAKNSAAVTPPSLKVTAAAPVQPGEVTTANARTKAQLLADELDREAGGDREP